MFFFNSLQIPVRRVLSEEENEAEKNLLAGPPRPQAAKEEERAAQEEKRVSLEEKRMSKEEKRLSKEEPPPLSVAQRMEQELKADIQKPNFMAKEEWKWTAEEIVSSWFAHNSKTMKR